MRLLPQAELMGPTWVLFEIREPGKRSRAIKVEEQPGPQPITAYFSEAAGTVSGTTGAERGGRAIKYDAPFKPLGAAQIDIKNVGADACKANKPMCKRQQQVVELMENATGYIVRSGDMRLLQDGTHTLWFRKQQPGATAE
jgi:hypothetical protein